MNRLTGTVSAVESADHISLVDVAVLGDTFTAILVETPESAPYLTPGRAVEVLFKETEVSLAKQFHGLISLRNRIPGTVAALRKGRLLTEVTLDYRGITVVSVITTRSAERLGITVGDAVEGLIKANEVILREGTDHAL